MTLNFGRANETYRVEALDLPPKVAKRLEALGMVRETEVMAFLPDQTAACKCKHCCIVHPALLPAQTQ